MIASVGLAGALAVLAGAPQPVQGPWILTCNMPPLAGQTSSGEHRRFRIGRGLFQEWNAQRGEFGPNLCSAFSCARNPDRLEGSISSPTLILTVSLDPHTGAAAWKTQGATGLRATSGPCSAKPDASAPAPKK